MNYFKDIYNESLHSLKACSHCEINYYISHCNCIVTAAHIITYIFLQVTNNLDNMYKIINV